MKAIINARIYDFHHYKDNYYIKFDNKIQEVGKMSQFNDQDIIELIDAKNGFVIPGLIAGHTHLYSAFARGMNVEFNPQNFLDVLKQLWWKLDHFIDNETLYYSSYSAAIEQMQCGTTTLIDHHASFNIKDSLNTIKRAIVDDLGMRGILCFETSDRFDIDIAISENIDFINNNKSSRVCGLFGLHASFTLSDDTLRKVSEKLNGNGIHIHVAESIKDEDDSIKKYGKTVVERLRDFNLINDKSILVHCTNATENELKIVKEHNANICLNVTSNLNNAVGLPNIRQMFDLDINVFIGNDGLIQSMPIEYLNSYYTSHFVTKNPIGFSLDSLKKSIINVYDYTSKMLNTKLGKIEKNYEADLLIVPYNEYTPINQGNVFSHIFFGLFPGMKPSHVFIEGMPKIINYDLVSDISNYYEKAIKYASELWKTIEKEGNNLEFKNNI